MESLSEELIQIHERSLNNELAQKNMEPFLKKIDDNFRQLAISYHQKRIKYNSLLLLLANEKIKQLEKIFIDHKINAEIIDTSSLRSGINLINDSDIDITILVNDCTVEMKGHIEKLLIDYEYQRFVNGYYLFSQKVDNVEFEIKLREHKPALPIIDLHHKMNNLPEREKIIITYGKFLFHNTKYYNMFKMLVYNMYFVGIKGAYLLQ